jgi:isopenicillin N synthase-like dioxygenase
MKTNDFYTRELPVIDLNLFLNDESYNIDALAKQLQSICENLGFLCITNHGISDSLIQQMYQVTKDFHSLPDEEKLRVKATKHLRGYIASRRIDKNYHKPDSVECFIAATDYPTTHPNLILGKRFYSRNIWPNNLPEFKTTVENYVQSIQNLGLKLLPLWAKSLNLPNNYFEPYFKESYSHIRIAKYPQKNSNIIHEFGLGSHADTGFMTFLPIPEEQGLQIMDEHGQWFYPQIPKNAIVVNIGQFLSRWTNGRFRATPHRVLPPVNNDRYSFACFINPSLDVEVECISSNGEPAIHPKQCYAEFFENYIKNHPLVEKKYVIKN